MWLLAVAFFTMLWGGRSSNCPLCKDSELWAVNGPNSSVASCKYSSIFFDFFMPLNRPTIITRDFGIDVPLEIGSNAWTEFLNGAFCRDFSSVSFVFWHHLGPFEYQMKTFTASTGFTSRRSKVPPEPYVDRLGRPAVSSASHGIEP